MFKPIRFVALFGLLATALALQAQSASESSSSLPDAPSARPQLASRPPAPQPAHTADGAYEHGFRGSVSCGGALGLPKATGKAAVAMCGAGISYIPYTVTEIGAIGPLSSPAHFYVSEDFVAPLTPTLKHLYGAPLGLVGYTKIVGNSNRFDYGIGWDHHLGDGKSLAFEARDYMQLENTTQHIVMFRISLAEGGDWD